MTGQNDYVAYVKPTYNIYQLGDIYKIVKFKNTIVSVSSSLSRLSTEEFSHYDHKLAASVSRSRRMILEKALCNPWDWFCTFTLDPTKYDRSDLPKFQKDFSQFIRDERKRGHDLSYIIVPELHADLKTWHLHGLLRGDPGLVSFKDWRKSGHKVTTRLVKDDFFTWPRYHEKFGFCSLGRIRCHVRSAFYISKYLSKDNSRLVSVLGANLYSSSVGLNTAVKHGEVYGHEPNLDRFLEKDYEFCQVGMTWLHDHVPWHFALEFMDLPPECFSPVFEAVRRSEGFWEDMAAIQYDQLSMFGEEDSQ